LSIKYSANVRNVRAEEYSSKELLGAMGKVDLFIVKDERGAMCAMAVNKPFVCVAEDGAVEKCFNDFAGEEILFDIDKISGEELYTKIKIAWVHKEAIAVEMLKKNQELKKLAVSGIKKLNEAAGL
jgi:polysaccharide pyruvyl transferase WcaK-like protein